VLRGSSRVPDDNRVYLIYIVYLMAGTAYLGEFEHIVLLAVLRLGDTAYGVTVRQEIEIRTGRDVSIGAIYATLSRLEAKGLVKSRAGEPTPERGGRAKRLFRVTALGRRSVNEAQRVLARMLDGLDPIGSFS
jgi:PadR family transcriptional regulator PadR